MKKLVSIALVVLILGGAVAFADSENVITKRVTKRPGGSGSSQGVNGVVGSGEPLGSDGEKSSRTDHRVKLIDRATLKGNGDKATDNKTVSGEEQGHRVIENKVVERSPQGSGVVSSTLTGTPTAPTGLKLVQKRPSSNSTGSSGNGASSQAGAGTGTEPEKLLSQGLQGDGFYRDEKTNETYWYDSATDRLIKVATTKSGITYYNDSAAGNKKMIWVPGTGEGDSGSFKQMLAGASAPNAIGVDKRISESLSKDAPKYLTGGFYVDGNGDIYEVTNGVATKVFKVNDTYTKTQGNTTYRWNTATGKWEKTTGLSPADAHVNDSPDSASKTGLYSDGKSPPTYRMGHKEATGTVFYPAMKEADLPAPSASNAGRVIYVMEKLASGSVVNVGYVMVVQNSTTGYAYKNVAWYQSMNNGTGGWK